MAADRRSIEMGKGHVTLATEKSQLEKGLDAAAKDFKAFGKVMGAVGASVAAIGASIVAPFYQGLNVLSEFSKEAITSMREAGLSFKEFDTLSDGMRVDGDTLTKSLAKMSTFLVEAANGSTQANEALRDMSLTIEELTSLSVGERALAIADGISRIGDASLRVARQRAVFGKSGLELNIVGGRSGIEQRSARADELGGNALHSEESLSIARAYNEAVREMGIAIKGFWASIGVASADTMTSIIRAITSVVVPIRKWIEENRELFTTIFRTGLVIGAIGTAIATLGGIIYGAGIAFGVMSTIVANTLVVFGILGAWIPTLIVWSDYLKYSIFGVTAAFRLFGVELRDIYAPLGVIDDLFDSFIDTIKQLAGGAWDWIKESPLNAYVEQAVDLFNQLWASITPIYDAIMDVVTGSDFGPLLADIGKMILASAAIGAALLGVAGYVAYLVAKWSTDLDAMRKTWETVTTYVKNSDWLKYWRDGSYAIIAFVRDAFNLVYGPLVRIGGAIIESVGKAREGAAQIWTAFSDAGSRIGAALTNAWIVTAREFSRMASGLMSTASTAWSGILGAFKVSDWQTIWKIIQTGAMLAWTQIKAFIEPTFNAWSDAMEDAFAAAFLAVKVAFITVVGEMKAGFLESFAAILDELGLSTRAASMRDAADTERLRAQAVAERETTAARIDDRTGLSRLLRDMEASSESEEETARLQRQLELMGEMAAKQARIAAANGLPVADFSGTPGLGGGHGSVVVGTSNQLLFGSIGSVGGSTPAERSARAAETLASEMTEMHRDLTERLRAIERVAGVRFS